MKGQPMATPCSLCGAFDPLIASHLVPDFFIRSLERRIVTGSKGETQPTSIALSTRAGMKGGRKQRGHWEKEFGIKEPLLCAKCEGQFSTYESYFREYFYGNAPAPLVKQQVGDLVSGPKAGFRGMLECRSIKVNYCLLKLFVLSLVWRASVGKGKFFEAVSLGTKHEERLAEALRTENPGDEDDYAVGMIDLRHEGDGMVDLIDSPEVIRDEENQRLCRFVIGGFAFMVHIGAEGHRPSATTRVMSLKNDGSMVVLVVEGSPIMQQWANRLKRANAFPVIPP